MGKQPAFQFYPGDWRRDTQVQMASLATRGVWIEMLCCMWDAPERGKLTGTYQDFSRLIGCTVEEIESAIQEIQRYKIGEVSVTEALHVTQCNKNVTVINRRMYKEYLESLKVRKQTRSRVQKYRENKKKNECNAKVTLPSSSSSSITPPTPLKGEGALSQKRDFKKESQKVLDYLNEKFHRKFSDSSQIITRLKQGGTVEQCKQIIDTKSHDPHFQKNPHLFCPATLFRKSHWDTYLNQKPSDFKRDGPEPVIVPYKPPELPKENDRVSPEEIRETRKMLNKKGLRQ